MFSHIRWFDETIDPAADYDLYLRIARQFQILCHHKSVVEYRRHESNMCNDPRVMLEATLTALKHQQKYVAGNPELSEAYEIGQKYWKNLYGEPLIDRTYECFEQGNVVNAARNICTLKKCFPERFLILAGRKVAKLLSALKKKPFSSNRS